MSSNPNLSGNPNAEAGPGPRTVGQGPGTVGPSGQPTITPAQKREEERRKEIEERKRKEREEVLVKKDKSLGEMLVMLEDYQPLVGPPRKFAVTNGCYAKGRANLDERPGIDPG